MVGQPQTVQVPNYSGVNIQIFNPSVAAPGASVPAPSYNTTNYNTMPSYPQNYYTQNLAPQMPAPAPAPVPVAPPVPDKKKTEKREIVKLTDDYIRNLENYLNNRDPRIRLSGAKEVVLRLQEDPSRKNDPALNALTNKMLQDPYESVKFFALAALTDGSATGNEQTVKLLKNIEQKKTGYGEDSLIASQILLRMSGNKIEKEFEVKSEKPKVVIKKVIEKQEPEEQKETKPKK